MNGSTDNYPISLSVDYPDRKVNRLTSFFRIFTMIPISIVAGLMAQTLPMYLYSNGGVRYETGSTDWNNFMNWLSSGGTDMESLVTIFAIAAVLWPFIMFIGAFIANLFNPVVLMLVFRQKYPKWWFDYYVMLIKFLSRVFGYFALLTDIYPSTDEEQYVHIEIPYPDVKKDLSQGLPLIKWFLAIPHYIVLCFVAIAAAVCDICIWFAILFTGRVPRGLFDVVVGSYRWGIRVASYAVFQFTDKYPPFSLD